MSRKAANYCDENKNTTMIKMYQIKSINEVLLFFGMKSVVQQKISYKFENPKQFVKQEQLVKE